MARSNVNKITITLHSLLTKICDKQDDFEFDTVNFPPFFDGDVRPSWYIILCIYFSTSSFRKNIKSGQ